MYWRMFLEAIEQMLLDLQAEQMEKWEKHLCTQARFQPIRLQVTHITTHAGFQYIYWTSHA